MREIMKEAAASKVFVLVFAVLFVLSAGSRNASAAEFETISYSAQVSLNWLAAAGVPEAKKILKTIGRPNILTAENVPDFKRVEQLNAVHREITYEAINDFVYGNGYKNVLDIACGYSPRGLAMSQKGIHYIGTELQAVAVSADAIMKKNLNKKYHPNLAYETAYAQDEKTMTAIADKFDGEICIIDQDVIAYIDRDDLDKMFDNINHILTKHGGCYITSDFSVRHYLRDVAVALYGKKEAHSVIVSNNDLHEDLVSENPYYEVFKSKEEAVKFLAAHGLEAREIPLFNAAPKLYCEKKLSAEQKAGIEKLFGKNYLWVITVKK